MQYLKSVAELKNADIFIGPKQILKQVDFSIAKAEFCYVIGKTGTGKTSLLKTLYGQLPLQAGIGKVAGFSLNGLKNKDIPSLRRRLGMIFQNFELFSDWTVERNLGFVLRATDWKDQAKRSKRIDEVLDAVDMTSFRKQTVSELSGGEQQRVAIARAILNQPDLIIGDEPTGNLDPETSEDILHLLRDLAISNKTAVLISTHDYRLLDKFPARVYECIGGQLIEKM